jgi:AcrR family transcriptional regulator
MGTFVARTPRDQRREAIMEVAREVFFEEGYAAASMSSIAARLGGSKGTLYNYFRSKEELFEAQIREGCARVAEDVFEHLSHDGPVGEVLTRLGEHYLDHIFSDWAVRTFRLIVAEATRSPQLARVFYEVGPAVGLQRLEAYLTEARARGMVEIPDCALAAEEFLSLCRGHKHFTYVLNLEPQPSPDEIRTYVQHAVTLFLKTYGAQTPA